MGRIILLVGVVAAVVVSGSAAAPTVLPTQVPPFPFVKLLSSIRSMGDAEPTSALWVASRRSTAVKATMGSGANTNQPVYVAVLTGSFTDQNASGPPGAGPPSGTVATFVYDAVTGMVTDFGLSNAAPDLAKLGTVHDFLPYLAQAAAGSAAGANGAPADIAASLETQWLERLSAGSRLGCGTRFHNVPESTVRARIVTAAAAGGFQVASVQFLQACQAAPLVELTSADPQGLVAALPGLEQSIDRVSMNGKTAWAFEGIFIAAADSSGDPYVVIWNHFRAEAVGGQWAASGVPFPFAHG